MKIKFKGTRPSKINFIGIPHLKWVLKAEQGIEH